MIERRFCEVRAAGGRSISGVAMKYGAEAVLPTGIVEVFEAGAFGDVGGIDVILNYAHVRERPLARTGGGGLLLEDSAEALRFRAEMPATTDGDDVLELVRRRVLTGASVEFVARAERLEGHRRIIPADGALLAGIGIVDRAAYEESTVEARARIEGTTISATVESGSVYECGCGPSWSDAVVFRPGMFARLLEAVGGGKNVVASFGAYDRMLGSTSAGSLRLALDDDDNLEISIVDPVDSSSTRDLLSAVEAGEFITARPYWQVLDADGLQRDGTTAILEPATASIEAVIVTTTTRNKGWQPVAVSQRSAPRSRRRVVW